MVNGKKSDLESFEKFLNENEDTNEFFIMKELLEATGRNVIKEGNNWKIYDSIGSRN